MANDDWIAARGGMLPAEFPYGAVRKNYYKLTTSTAAVFMGQPMTLDANGQATATMTSFNTGGTIVNLLGPVIGFADVNLNALPSSMLNLTVGPSMPASTDGFVQIADDPDQIFIMQVNTNGTAITSANLVDYCTFNYRSTSGSTLTGFSTAEVDNTTLSNVGSGNLQVMGLYPLKNSDGSTNSVGNFAKVRVRITAHVWGSKLTNYTAL